MPARARTSNPESTTARGYGSPHKRERARLKVIVDAGGAYCTQGVCVMASRWIQPGTPWALGHNDDRTAWLGPTHATCNQLDGASKGGHVIARRKYGAPMQVTPTQGTVRASRSW